VEYANFCRLIQKGAVVTLVFSWVTGPIFIEFAQDVGKILPLNIFELNLAYSSPFSNVSLPNEGHFLISPKIANNFLGHFGHKQTSKQTANGEKITTAIRHILRMQCFKHCYLRSQANLGLPRNRTVTMQYTTAFHPYIHVQRRKITMILRNTLVAKS